MKKKIMKAGILIVVFCAAVIISSLVINKDVSDEAADMGAASLPEISFYVGETEVNPLFGYVNKMEISAVRDTITPLKNATVIDCKSEKNTEIRSINLNMRYIRLTERRNMQKAKRI